MDHPTLVKFSAIGFLGLVNNPLTRKAPCQFKGLSVATLQEFDHYGQNTMWLQ